MVRYTLYIFPDHSVYYLNNIYLKTTSIDITQCRYHRYQFVVKRVTRLWLLCCECCIGAHGCKLNCLAFVPCLHI